MNNIHKSIYDVFKIINLFRKESDAYVIKKYKRTCIILITCVFISFTMSNKIALLYTLDRRKKRGDKCNTYPLYWTN